MPCNSLTSVVHTVDTLCSERLYFYWIFSVIFFEGRPEEQDDSENSTIYITGLTEKANLEEMAEFFKHVGPIRVRRALHS